MVEIKSDRLTLSPWKSIYLNDLIGLFSKPEIRKYISGGRPINEIKCSEISQKWISQWGKYGYGPWAALDKESGKWIGEIGLEFLDDWPLHDKWEVGWILDPEFWGQGLATEGGKTAVQFGFAHAKLQRIISPTVPENMVSRRVMEKCGLTYQGLVHWRKTECVWYAIDIPATR